MPESEENPKNSPKRSRPVDSTPKVTPVFFSGTARSSATSPLPHLPFDSEPPSSANMGNNPQDIVIARGGGREDDHVPQRTVSNRAGSDLDHRIFRTRGQARSRDRIKIPLTEYVKFEDRYLDAGRFTACPITAPGDPNGRNQAYQARWNHGMTDIGTVGQTDLPYLRHPEEGSYEKMLNHLVATRQLSRAADSGTPRLDLVKFDRPFDRLYFFRERRRHGSNVAFESRLRHREKLLIGWHNVEVHSVPRRFRRSLYAPLPDKWVPAPQFLCVPTPPVLAYYGRFLIPCCQRADQEDMCRLVPTVAFSEFAVLTLLSLLFAARDGFPFDTRCADRRMYQRDNEHAPRGRLLWIAPALEELIRLVGIPGILGGTMFTEADAEEVFSEMRHEKAAWWRDAPRGTGVAWFDWRTKRTVPAWESRPAQLYDWAPMTEWGEIPTDDRRRGVDPSTPREDTGWSRAVQSPHSGNRAPMLVEAPGTENTPRIQGEQAALAPPNVGTVAGSPTPVDASLIEMPFRGPFQPRRRSAVDERTGSGATHKTESPGRVTEAAAPAPATTPETVQPASDPMTQPEKAEEKAEDEITFVAETRVPRGPEVKEEVGMEAPGAPRASASKIPRSESEDQEDIQGARVMFRVLQESRRGKGMKPYSDICAALTDLYQRTFGGESDANRRRSRDAELTQLLRTQEDLIRRQRVLLSRGYSESADGSRDEGANSDGGEPSRKRPRV